MNYKTAFTFTLRCTIAASLSALVVACSKPDTSEKAKAPQPQAVETKESLLGGGYTLEIFGNANGDWHIDQKDIDFIEKIIAGTEQKTPFADANQDGAIDQKDIEQVQKIIADKADNLWLLDGNKKNIKVSLPVQRIGVEYHSNAELMNVLGVADKVVATEVGAHILRDVYFPKNKDLMNMGQVHSNPNFEKILDMDLDVLFTFPANITNKTDNLPDTNVVFLGLYWPNVMQPESSRFMQGVIKAGYIVGKKERAYDYANWLLGIVKDINQRTTSLTEAQRPKVLMTSHSRYFKDGETKAVSIFTQIDPLSQACMLAGCSPVAEKIPKWSGKGSVYATTVGLEWLMTEDPDFIFAHSVRHTYGGTTREPAHGYEENSREGIDKAVQDMKALPLVKDLKAAKNDNIYITSGDFRNNAMGGILGAAYLAKVMHPQLFADFDPKAIHQEFVSDWMQLPMDLSKQGVFIAPALKQ